MKSSKLISILELFVLSTIILALFSCAKDTTNTELKKALTLYASFDKGIDADIAAGDKRLYTVPNRKARDSAQAGLHKSDISIAKNEGLFGDGLLFTKRSKGNIYYPSLKNIAYNSNNWSGAISFWLHLDPTTDLVPGEYCDPIQITDVSYNDASIWVDFTKENPRDFRLGVIGDRDSWNPNPEGPDNENPIFIEQLPVVKNPPFGRGKWTHILINFSNLNTENGHAALFINGELKGERMVSDPFTWELEHSNIYLGLGYIGLMDELSIYNRDLTVKEIQLIYNLKNGVHSLLQH